MALSYEIYESEIFISNLKEFLSINTASFVPNESTAQKH
jgi:hypothetical protein